MQRLRVDEQRVDFVAEEVADDASGEAGLALQQRRCAHLYGLALDLLPESVQVVDLALAALLRQVFRHGTDDPAAGILGDELADHLAQLGPLLAVLDLARDADLGGERHVHKEATRQRDLRGHARALGADWLFDDLNELGLALLQLVRDVRQAAPRPATAPAPPPAPAPVPPVLPPARFRLPALAARLLFPPP